MKKFALLLASALLVLSAASAMAAVPSKTTTDVTHVKSVETVKEDGKTEAAGWDIDVTEDEAPGHRGKSPRSMTGLPRRARAPSATSRRRLSRRFPRFCRKVLSSKT